MSLTVAGGLLAGLASASPNSTPVRQVAYASYEDFETVGELREEADLVVRGTVLDDGVRFIDFGRKGEPEALAANDGIGMRMVELELAASADEGQLASGRAALSTLHVAFTDVGLDGLSSDATLREGDEVVLVLERIDAAEFELSGVDV
ncbi:MAG: hypothetical protein GY925_05625 [Actinomycetia bacterium]|nr:hypothetical protein [Actinomycetes bacterium]